MKTMGDAFFLRNHLIGVLEQAEVEADPGLKRELLTFLVVGAGYTGVEVAAEINSFVREAAKSYRHIDQHDVKVILLHRGSRILPVLNDKLAAFSHAVLERRGLEIRLGTSIKGATAQSAILDDGTVIQTRTLVLQRRFLNVVSYWPEIASRKATQSCQARGQVAMKRFSRPILRTDVVILVAAIGSAPNPLLDKTPVGRDQRGRVVVGETLAVPGHPGIWAVGDCAAVPDLHGGGTCPPTAQYALRQARHLARNILAEIRGSALRPFSHKNLGVFVPLGRFSAAADVLGIKLSGILAWCLYRTYYLLQLPRLERKLRVVTDWTLELAFRRDIVQIDTFRSHGISRAHYETGELIYREGDLARNFYTILSGRVQVVRQQAEGESLVASLEAGEYFGEMSLLQGLRHSASVRAVTPTDVLIMSGPDFKALAGSSIYFGETLAEVMRRRLSDSGEPIAPG